MKTFTFEVTKTETLDQYDLEQFENLDSETVVPFMEKHGDKILDKTFKRIPDDIILYIAGSELDLGDPKTCVCGWALNAAILAGTKRAKAFKERFSLYPDINDPMSSGPDEMVHVFGGEPWEWAIIYYGVVMRDVTPFIELAFLRRLQKALTA